MNTPGPTPAFIRFVGKMLAAATKATRPPCALPKGNPPGQGKLKILVKRPKPTQECGEEILVNSRAGR